VTTHSFHDEILEAGLDDECLRCVELADHPDQLDDVNRARIEAGHLYSRLDRVAAMRLQYVRRTFR
jgi:hypothetical protein